MPKNEAKKCYKVLQSVTLVARLYARFATDDTAGMPVFLTADPAMSILRHHRFLDGNGSPGSLLIAILLDQCGLLNQRLLDYISSIPVRG